MDYVKFKLSKMGASERPTADNRSLARSDHVKEQSRVDK